MEITEDEAKDANPLHLPENKQIRYKYKKRQALQLLKLKT